MEKLKTAVRLEAGAPEEERDAMGSTVVESRSEPRYSLFGEVTIQVLRPVVRTVTGHLRDVSVHGFRASYDGSLLPSGTEVTFEHELIQGRARVVWSRYLPEHNESGFYILSD